MEKYTVAELDVVALANAETVSASTVVPGENELPIDPSPNNNSGTTYTMT